MEKLFVVRDEVNGEYLVRAASKDAAIAFINARDVHWKAVEAWEWTGTYLFIAWRR